MEKSKSSPKRKAKEPKPKYELTLAEFPLAVLSTKKPKDMKVLEYHDTIRGQGGKPVDRIWRVKPSEEFGWAGPTIYGTLYELFQIWSEQGFQNRNIRFGTVWNLLQRKFLRDGNENYKVMVRDLRILNSILIDAINAFYDPEKNAYVDRYDFKLFEYLDFYKESPTGQATLPFGYIRASETLWESIEKKSIFPLGIPREVFHSLSPLEQRLSLYLDKMFRKQHTHYRDIFKLATQLPIHSKAKKKMKQTLKNACEGLIKKGYDRLADFEFKKSADGQSEIIYFYRAGDLDLPFEKPPKPPINTSPPIKSSKDPKEMFALVEEIVEQLGDEKSRGFYTLVVKMIPSANIYGFLSEIRQEARESGIQNKGAIFNIKAQRYAQEQGIELGLKETGQKSAASEDKKGGGESAGARGEPQRPASEVSAAEGNTSEENERIEKEGRELDSFYQGLSPEKKKEIDALAEKMLPDFLKERLRESRAKGEESYGVEMGLINNRNKILKDMMKEKGRGQESQATMMRTD